MEIIHPSTSSSLFGLVAERLSSLEAPVVSDYSLGKIIFNEALASQTKPEKALYGQVLNVLRDVKLLTPHKDFKTGAVFSLFGKTHPKPAEIACAVDPFAYMTHLSAMEYHGLTDRLPQILYLCTPPQTEWRKHAHQRQVQDLGNEIATYKDADFPPLSHPRFAKISGMTIQVLERSKLGAFKTIKNSPLRVATLGRTFLDMLREPQDCGGIQHVIDVYRQNAKRCLPLITEEVERNGTAIDKVRCGYLLTEVCHLSHPTLTAWANFAQRGGSRKLDPAGEYASSYSERWQLSLNVPSLYVDNAQDE